MPEGHTPDSNLLMAAWYAYQTDQPEQTLMRMMQEAGSPITPAQAKEAVFHAFQMFSQGEGEGGALEGRWPQYAVGDMIERQQDAHPETQPVFDAITQQNIPRIQGATARSGDPTLDALIEQYLQRGDYHLYADMGIHPNERAPLNDLRSPEGAMGRCEVLAADFADFVTEHGLEADVDSTENVTSFPGYAEAKGELNDHAVTYVLAPTGRYNVDWTASQFGFSDFPKVVRVAGTQPAPDKRSSVEHTAMAERSGFPELDAAIAEFMQTHPEVNDFREPHNAHGRCEESAQELAAFLKARGFKAYAPADELHMFPGYQNAQKSEDIGAGDFTYPEHAMVEVYGLYGPNNVNTVTIDFTASQYGFTEFPKVHGGPADRQGSVTPPDNGVYGGRVAGETLPQQQRRWHTIWDEHGLNEADAQPLREHLDDGWSVDTHESPASIHAVGRMMNNCWQSTKPEHMEEQAYQGWKYHSLHDDLGIPRAAWYTHDDPWTKDGPRIRQALGTRNAPVDPEHAPRIQAWADQQGVDTDGAFGDAPSHLQAQAARTGVGPDDVIAHLRDLHEGLRGRSKGDNDLWWERVERRVRQHPQWERTMLPTSELPDMSMYEPEKDRLADMSTMTGEPPAIVVDHDGLVDGLHRSTLALQRGDTHIPALRPMPDRAEEADALHEQDWRQSMADMGVPLSPSPRQGSITSSDNRPYVSQMGSIPSEQELQPYVADDECYEWTNAVAEKWPHLPQDSGFYVHPRRGPGDHAWNRAPDGTIVDTTSSQHPGPMIVAPDHPHYPRYVSWASHPDRAQSMAHAKGYHTGDEADYQGICPDCDPSMGSVTSSDKGAYGSVRTGEHDYDPNWDYDVLFDQYDHPLVQQAQQIATRLSPGSEVHPVDLSHQGVVAKYVDGTYSRPVIVFDPFWHENAHPEEVENTIRHELRHAEQESRGEDYDEDDAEHGWRGDVTPPDNEHYGAAPVTYFHATPSDSPVFDSGLRAGSEVWHDRDQALRWAADRETIGGSPIDVYEVQADDVTPTNDPRGTSLVTSAVPLARMRMIRSGESGQTIDPPREWPEPKTATYFGRLASDEVPDHIPEDWTPEPEPGTIPASTVRDALSQMRRDDPEKAQRLAEEVAESRVPPMPSDDGMDWAHVMRHLYTKHLLGLCHRCDGEHKVIPQTGTLSPDGKPGTIGGLPADLCAYCRGDEQRPPKPRNLTRLTESEFGHPVVVDATSPRTVDIHDQRQHSDYDPCGQCGKPRGEHRYTEYELAKSKAIDAEKGWGDSDHSAWVPAALNHHMRDQQRPEWGTPEYEAWDQQRIRYHPWQEPAPEQREAFPERHSFDRPSLESALVNGGGDFKDRYDTPWTVSRDNDIYHLRQQGDNPYTDPGFKVPVHDLHSALGIDTRFAAVQAGAYDQYWSDEPSSMLRQAEYMAPEHCLPYREYDWSADNNRDGSEHWNALRDHVAQHGFNEPAFLHYNPTSGKGYFGEGNHRVGIAHELGIPVPVVVYRMHSDDERYKPITEPGKYRYEDARGFSQFGQYETPSRIGLPVVPGPEQRTANILDAPHSGLDPAVWLDPESPEPILKPELRHWLETTIKAALAKHGYDGMDEWLSLVLTGSLTTYQYSVHSDCDISLWVDAPKFPEWSRAEMIAAMVSEFDDVMLPGTTHPVQAFVVASTKLKKDDLYAPGLRSGYDLQTQRWIEPPDRSRVHDVEHEMNGDYTYALEVADKMESLLRHEPDKAISYWNMIHKRRQRDQGAGKGDFSQANIVYKMVLNRFESELRDLGIHIA